MSADETEDREDDEASPPEPDSSPEPAETPWAEKVALARRLWDAGDNARLRGVLDELEKAPPEEEEARTLAADLRRRLKPDPVAIALWGLTFLVFCVLVYVFVIR